jgi:hypothetical protein
MSFSVMNTQVLKFQESGSGTNHTALPFLFLVLPKISSQLFQAHFCFTKFGRTSGIVHYNVIAFTATESYKTKFQPLLIL